jgi:PAS domain S-box-containing protein
MTTTALKPQEQYALESPAQLVLLSKALRAVDSGIMVTDRKGRIIWINPALGKSMGYEADEVVGKTPGLFKSGKHDRQFYRQFWDTILCGETWRGQFVNRRRDGILCVLSQTTTPVLHHAGGRITHFISVYEEITTRRQSEEAPAEVRNLETVGQLAAGIAHHLNNFLTVIHCNSQLLLNRNVHCEVESRDLVSRTLAASDHAAHFVRQLVAFSRGQVVQLQAVDLNQVVESSLSVFRRNFKGIEWDPHYGASLPPVFADSAMLVQVISNLLVNSLDAMPAGGRLTLTTENILMKPADTRRHCDAREGGFVCLSIQDTGCGISPANLRRIFEPFFTTKNTGDRCGLGLALVHGIVKQHEGWTEARSEAGRGTTIKVFLPVVPKPVAVVDSEPPSLAQSPKQSSQESESAGRGSYVEEHKTVSTFSPVTDVRGVPVTHWGINE